MKFVVGLSVVEFLGGAPGHEIPPMSAASSQTQMDVASEDSMLSWKHFLIFTC